MFGLKRFKNENGFNSGTTTLIAAGTKLTGDISFTGNLEIEGEVVGNVSAEGDKSRVRVLESGSVQGNIDVATIIVNGHVKGDLYASELVELAAKAVVEGNLNYNLIGIEKGAEVVGSFVYHSAESNITLFPADRDEVPADREEVPADRDEAV
ncbi:MAG: polymer-forming cytoskeletal protein [Porticoccaceae bacterium]|nr:polymer-forming cytoskeletal protein [Porticoccaceae bacterium]